MRAPGFWWNSPHAAGWQARLLTPAALLWSMGATLKRRRTPVPRAPVPVICIGNLTAGGGGKTPMVAALARRFMDAGRNVHVLGHGYSGRLRRRSGMLYRVDPVSDTARETGDEALVLAALAPTWIASRRPAGINAAAAAGAEIVIVDDGLQDPTVAPDRTIVMVDAATGFGNGRLMPSGPLREPVEAGISRADVVVLVGSEIERATAIARWPALAGALPATLVPLETGLSLTGERVLAFAGIARPAKFYATLETLGARIVRAVPFPDHYRYPSAMLHRLLREARTDDAILVTTEKDAARLPPWFRREVTVVQVRLEPADWEVFDRLLDL